MMLMRACGVVVGALAFCVCARRAQKRGAARRVIIIVAFGFYVQLK